VTPFPGPFQAVLLTLLASFLSTLVAVVALEIATPTAALGLAAVVGLGAAGALGAASVPPPHAERVGLRGLRARQLAPLLLLLPVALLASEADNVVKALWPPPDAPQVAREALEKLPTDTGLALVETLLVAVGLVPVVEEWFFRGVIQQGLVASLGAFGGVSVTSLLFALGHGGAGGLSPQSWAAAVAQSLVLGVAFGFARHATGSLLAAIALHVGVNAAGVLGLAFASALSIPGYNAPGTHTPPALLAAAAAAVALGAFWLVREQTSTVVVDQPDVGEDAPGPD
jgi:membrane protease YdiL (CAAX protease family)